MTESALTTTGTAKLAQTDLLDAFAAFLRLNVAEGDASPHTIRSYYTHVSLYVSWCEEHGINPAQATDKEIAAYRKALVDNGYKRSTIATKLSIIRRLYQAAVWRGLRADNPAAGVKAPRDRTARAERTKFLPLGGLKRLLQAPQGDGPMARRDRAMLALMGIHGLRVSEVSSLRVGDVDLTQGVITVTGKGQKARTVYLIEATSRVLEDWLKVRPWVAQGNVDALFVTLGSRIRGTAMSDRAIRYRVDGYLEILGLKDEGISCHALRHSAATWARAGGAALDAIAGMLGHTSVTTTQVYAKIVDRMTENPARYLEAVMGKVA